MPKKSENSKKLEKPYRHNYHGPERRKWPRLDQKLPLQVIHARPAGIARQEGFTIDPVWTRDLGGAGLGLNAPIHCPIGSELDLEFEIPGRDGRLHATVVVVYSKPETEKKKLFRVGVSYKAIKEDERQAIIYYVNDNLP